MQKNEREVFSDRMADLSYSHSSRRSDRYDRRQESFGAGASGDSQQNQRTEIKTLPHITNNPHRRVMS